MTERITQITEAKNGAITEEVFECAQKEDVDIEFIREKVANGTAVILKNKKRDNCAPIAIADGLRVKINANIGSNDDSSINDETDKARVVQQAGADTIMDLSKGNYLDEIRREIISACNIPVGTNPVFQACKNTIESQSSIENLSKDELFSQIEKHLEDGVDFITLHCSITKSIIEQIETQQRITGITSTTGSLLARYILLTGKENPLYEHFDELLDLIKQYDVVLSFGNALRPGCTFDAADRLHFMETIITGDLVKKARIAGVQSMVEFGGYIPLNKIQMMIKTTRELTCDAPLFSLGPIVLDSASGYDNITSSIGASIAAYHGASFLCCVSSAEQIAKPSISQIKEAIVASKIAAQSVDLTRGNRKAVEKNLSISSARSEVNIKKEMDNAIDKCAYDGIVSKQFKKN